MKINKLQSSVAFCCLVASLWSKAQAIEEFSGKEIKKAYLSMASITGSTIITDNAGNQHKMTISGVDLDKEVNKKLPTHIIQNLSDDKVYEPLKNLGKSTHLITLIIDKEKMHEGVTNSIFLKFEQIK